MNENDTRVQFILANMARLVIVTHRKGPLDQRPEWLTAGQKVALVSWFIAITSSTCTHDDGGQWIQ
jgi:hypothetical protein